MAIFPKPYDPVKKIIRSIFLGRPNIFADVDVNRQFEANQAIMDFVGEQVGGDSPILFSGSASYDGAGNLTYNVSMPATMLNIKGSTFNLAAVNFADVAPGSYKSLAFYLVARVARVTFAQDPVMSGINADTFAAPLAAADNLVYTDETVLAFPYPDINSDNIEAAIGGGYKAIDVLGGIIPVKNAAGSYSPRIATYTSRSVGGELKTLMGDKFNGKSLIEVMSHLLGYVKGFSSTSDKIGMTTFYTGPITGIWDTISGVGLSGGWTDWAIMDGNNGTVDARGKSFVGLNSGDFDFAAIGNTGGTKRATLTVNQLPNHKFPINVRGSVSNKWRTGDGTGSPVCQVGGVGEGVLGYNSTGYTSALGNGESHDNMPPYVVALPVQKIR